ncbi:MAG: hypothetical protein AAB647_02920 [Patescibacteria group bacterium]
MKIQVINFLGWLGVLIIISAYFLVTFTLVDPQSVLYLILNLIGSLLIVTETFSKRDFQPGILNIVWALIALVGLARIVFF